MLKGQVRFTKDIFQKATVKNELSDLSQTRVGNETSFSFLSVIEIRMYFYVQ
jgi:hypothetical protein